MSKEELKVKPVDQDVTNEDLKTIHGGDKRGCGAKDGRERIKCGSGD